MTDIDSTRPLEPNTSPASDPGGVGTGLALAFAALGLLAGLGIAGAVWALTDDDDEVAVDVGGASELAERRSELEAEIAELDRVDPGELDSEERAEIAAEREALAEELDRLDSDPDAPSMPTSSEVVCDNGEIEVRIERDGDEVQAEINGDVVDIADAEEAYEDCVARLDGDEPDRPFGPRGDRFEAELEEFFGPEFDEFLSPEMREELERLVPPGRLRALEPDGEGRPGRGRGQGRFLDPEGEEFFFGDEFGPERLDELFGDGGRLDLEEFEEFFAEGGPLDDLGEAFGQGDFGRGFGQFRDRTENGEFDGLFGPEAERDIEEFLDGAGLDDEALDELEERLSEAEAQLDEWVRRFESAESLEDLGALGDLLLGELEDANSDS